MTRAVMKPRMRPAVGTTTDPDDAAFADFCVLLIDAMQIPEVAKAVATAVAAHTAAAPWPVVPPVLRHSPPARGHRNR